MKETILHVRIDADLKAESEALFASMGTSLSEAVRIFLKQCILDQKFPFQIKSFEKKGGAEAYGFLNQYSKPIARETEREAWISSLGKK